MKLDNINKLIIGTRSSALALAQTELVIKKLEHTFPSINEIIEVKKIEVSGDKYKNKPLRDIGGKGLFTKEIDQALIENRIDIAIHSMKDVDSRLPKGLIIGGVIEREDPREFLLNNSSKDLKSLRKGSLIGTSSLRRKAQLLRTKPDLKFAELRGNILSRIDRLNAKEFDATVLAYAGLKRLGIKPEGFLVDLDTMLPCLGQGIIGINISEKNNKIRNLISHINDKKTFKELTSERSLLSSLGATCNTPICGLAEIKNDSMILRSEVYSLDGKECFSIKTKGSASDAGLIGSEAGKKLIDITPSRIIESWN
ncbi:MAG: hydroxymethylbilane synthase [Rhodospirillaceae bacterium]|nr:hydroxymethylbilane synthase [Rhodospirillaceae bacterium]|tara:strand:- start:2310 stop:3245 length:936 start_codon:yes stop_codon:yes gene_type:complete